MIRITLTLSLTLLFGSVCSSQETERRDRNAEKRQTEERRLVKDPSTFKTAGPTIFSGPQPREALSGFKATNLVGDEKGKDVDPIAAAGDKPQVLIFQDDSGVAIRGLFGIVDAIGKIERKSKKDLHVSCVFLTDDPDSINTRFGRVFPGLVKRGIDLIAVSQDRRDGPGAWGLNRTVSQTIILAENGKATHNFAFQQALLHADPHVLGGIAILAGEDLDKVEGWLASSKSDDRMRMRGANGEGDSRSAAKAGFRKKLGEFVKAGKITRADAGELYQAAFPEQE